MSRNYSPASPETTAQTTAEPRIRRAGPADAERLAEIGAITFTETFGHLYPPADLKAFLQEAHTAEKFARYLADPAQAAWLVEAGGEAVGYATVCPCTLPHPEVTAGCGELKRLYMLQRMQGSGMGSKLLAECLAWLERDGPRTLWIGVWSENLGAQRLYARHGFSKAGEYEFIVGETRDHEFILRRAPR